MIDMVKPPKSRWASDSDDDDDDGREVNATTVCHDEGVVRHSSSAPVMHNASITAAAAAAEGGGGGGGGGGVASTAVVKRQRLNEEDTYVSVLSVLSCSDDKQQTSSTAVYETSGDVSTATINGGSGLCESPGISEATTLPWSERGSERHGRRYGSPSDDDGDGDGCDNTAISSNAVNISMDEEKEIEEEPPYLPAIYGCRKVDQIYECISKIEEGTYGVVYRARVLATGEIVALKRLKMEKEREGFPITSLREINTLLKATHKNIVNVREIVVGRNMNDIYIVMEYVPHDIKALMETMKEPFLQGEVKTLLLQLLHAVAHMHDNWILHRDLKTSNLLLTNGGIMKVADFGLAREYGDPLKPYTQMVVTLWYRAPELLLGTTEYSTAVDMWSVGCIFAELISGSPLWCGKSEIDQIQKVFKALGTPDDVIWPGFSSLPHAQRVTFARNPYNQLREAFQPGQLTDSGYNLLKRMLAFDPAQRISAEEALRHSYFTDAPRPVDPSLFPTWPSKAEMKRRPSVKSPIAPSSGRQEGCGNADEENDGFSLSQYGSMKTSFFLREAGNQR